MQQNTLVRNPLAITFFGAIRLPSWAVSRIATYAAFVLALAGGWLAFNSSMLNEYGTPLLAIAGVALLIMSWRLGARTRATSWVILVAWHLGSGTAIPSGWHAFFGDNWGWLALVIWAAVASSPALLFPARFSSYALGISALLTAITPIGMMNPIIAATGLFPGGGWLGLAAAIGVLLLPSIPNKKAFGVAGIIVLFWGVIQNAQYDMHPPVVSNSAWAVETREGAQPTLAIDWFGRQGKIADLVQAGIEDGALLAVTPEGTVDKWDAWAKATWRHAIAASQEHKGMALVGIYRETPDGWQNGLLDLASGEFYRASVPMPVSMWRPWGSGHFPFDFSQLTRRIKTPVGDAAYLLCYEELLAWPLAAKMVHGHPDLLVSVANQWFSNSTTAETQKRSVNFQARLWGLPMLRAVNWPRNPKQ